jgi:hypothetical protein
MLDGRIVSDTDTPAPWPGEAAAERIAGWPGQPQGGPR